MVQPKPTASQKLCNCPAKDCPINGLRLTSSILYQATIKCNDSKYKKKHTKESLKRRPSRKVMQTKKNHSMRLILKRHHLIYKNKNNKPRDLYGESNDSVTLISHFEKM